MVIEPFCLLKGMFVPLDNIVLEHFINGSEKYTESGDAHQKIRVILGMYLGVFEDIRPDNVELDVLAAQGEIGLDE